MIGRLVGRLASKATDHVIVDVAGVGYLVQIPLSTFYELPEAERQAWQKLWADVAELLKKAEKK